MNEHARTRQEAVASAIGKLYVRALVVESDILHQQAARDILRQFKCQVDVAGDAQLAVALSQIVRYHLIFIDGDLLVGLRDTSPLRDLEVDGRCISVVSMLESSALIATHRHIAMGANDILPKPLNPESMRGVIEAWLNRGPADVVHRV